MVLHQTPHKFKGLTVLGDIIFIFDIILFLCFSAVISARFIMFPKTIRKCLSHPTESLFFPTYWISLSNILSNIQVYGVPHCGYWLIVTLRVFFWTYAAITFLCAVGQYFFLFTGSLSTSFASLTALNFSSAPLLSFATSG